MMTITTLFSRIFFLVLLLSGCNPNRGTIVVPTGTSSPTLSPSPLPFFSQIPTPIPDTGWQLLQPGFERRMMRLFNEENQHIESLYIYRLDQNLFRLDIAYHETPQNLEDWYGETNALLTVNGGFFRVEEEKYIPNGLTIVNGEILGTSYDSFAGMLAITDSGAELRWLTQKPYDPLEPIQAALQSFPSWSSRAVSRGFRRSLKTTCRRGGRSLHRTSRAASCSSSPRADISRCTS